MYIAQTNSTNVWLKLHPETDAVWTSWQTAGRGQAGNSWESEQGKNVLMSLRLTEPKLKAAEQFRLTMAVSLAVRDVVSQYLPEHEVKVKWPNDIYVGDRKICGILIEVTLAEDRVSEAIVGIGLNVNQTQWISNAPNPVSVKQLTQTDLDLETVYNDLCEAVNRNLTRLTQPEQLKQAYLEALYRFGKTALYAPREVNLTPSKVLQTVPQNAFEATITDVSEQGELVLLTTNGIQTYHFKQIQFVL